MNGETLAEVSLDNQLEKPENIDSHAKESIKNKDLEHIIEAKSQIQELDLN